MKGPSFNDADVERAILKPRLKCGSYLFRVTSAGVKDETSDTFTGKVNDKGNYVIPMRVAPVDGNGDTRSPSATMSLVGPFLTDPQDLAEAGLPADAQKKGMPRTDFLIERYVKARKSSKTPFDLPRVQKLKNVGGKWVAVDPAGNPTGETVGTKAEHKADLKAQAASVREFYITAYHNAGLLVGDEFFGEVGYDPTGKFDGAQIEVHENQDPTLLNLVDMTQSIEEIPEAGA